ncbi:MAG: hypothetical protein HYW93_04520 [Thaumarchaeota archaeon]|nr:hypothetical protein [Nitrososphaerota archaeon]
MYYTRSGLKPVVASLAVLVLLVSGGVFAYDTRIQSGINSDSPGLHDDITNQTSQYLKFELVPLPVASTYKSGQGYAKVMIQDHTVTVWLSLTAGTPSAKLVAVMPVISERGNHSISLGTLTSSDGGNAELQTQTQFDSGNYQVGLELFDVSTFDSEVMVVVSNPAYARVVITDQSSTSTTSTQSKTTTTSRTETKSTTANLPNILQFHLIPFATAQGTDTPDDYPFKEGAAVIYLTPTQIGLKVSFVGVPTAGYVLVLQENGANVTVGRILTDERGSGVFYSLIPLEPGTYQFGFLLYFGDVEHNQLVALSDPRTATATLPTIVNTTTETTTTYTRSTTSTSTTETKTESEHTTESTNAGENVIPLKLLPLPAYLLTAQPDNYPFRGGGAVIHVRGNSLQLVVSFLGAPRTQFAVVLQTNDQNLTLGSVTTNQEGGGVLKKEFSFDPGVYRFGILIYLSTTAAEQGNLVALSTPRGVTVKISSTTTSESGTETETEGSGSRTRAEFEFSPVPVANVPTRYAYGHGVAVVEVRDAGIVVSAKFEGQNPNTHYILVLVVNGTAHKIGEYLSDDKGEGRVTADAVLGVGIFMIGLQVLDASTFTVETLALTSDPRFEIISTVPGDTTITTTTSTSEREDEVKNQVKHELKFRIVPAPIENVPAGYSFGAGETNISVDGQVLRLKMEIHRANPTTQYGLSLSVNGTSTRIGSFVTNHEGNGQVRAEVKLDPGTYLIGVLVHDTSTFTDPTLVLTSSPSSLIAIVVIREKSSTTTSTSETATQSATTITAGKDDEDDIELAVSSLTIPAVVHVGSSNSTFAVLDPRFSVSVGRQAEHGLIISISATNVTGPRVLLLNLTQNSFLKVAGSALNVTLDGNPVQQAASVTQVLNPSPSDPARYVLVATSSGIQMLVSIPHFSLHFIEVIPIPVAQIQNLLIVNSEALVVSILAITVIFAAVYKTRHKIFSILL